MKPTHGQVKQKAIELQEFLSDKLAGTFPHRDAKKFAARFGEEGDRFIAAMEVFHSNIAGYCNSGSKWLQASEQRIAECRRDVGKSFFDHYPALRKFEAHLPEFPDLVEVMTLYEVARKRLIALMATLEQVKKR